MEPLDNTVNTPLLPLFTWSEVSSDKIHYLLVVEDINNNIVLEKVLTDNRYSLIGDEVLEFAKEYTWHVIPNVGKPSQGSFTFQTMTGIVGDLYIGYCVEYCS